MGSGSGGAARPSPCYQLLRNRWLQSKGRCQRWGVETQLSFRESVCTWLSARAGAWQIQKARWLSQITAQSFLEV